MENKITIQGEPKITIQIESIMRVVSETRICCCNHAQVNRLPQ